MTGSAHGQPTVDRTPDGTTVSEADLRALPPSAKLVLKVLEVEGTLTLEQLREHTRLPRRTVRHGFTLLSELGLVERRTHPMDARKSIYTIVASRSEESETDQRE